MATIPASDAEKGSNSCSSRYSFPSPNATDESSVKDDDAMDISVESTESMCEESVTLLFSSVVPVNSTTGTSQASASHLLPPTSATSQSSGCHSLTSTIGKSAPHSLLFIASTSSFPHLLLLFLDMYIA